MWTLNLHAPAGDPITVTVTAGQQMMTHDEIIQAWRQDDAFAAFWSDALATLPFDAFAWEMPPLTEAALPHPFECMVFDSPMLARMVEDPAPFAEHMAGANGASIVTFANISGDAHLVVPVGEHGNTVHTHLASFLRSAPLAQTRALWAAVAETVSGRIGKAPVWVSTAGLGVGWLHVRVSSLPKYYRCRDYAAWQGV